MKGISILFSGGPDSTLAALRALDQAEEVHLLTFFHWIMAFKGKHKLVADELVAKFGKDRVFTHEDRIDDGFKKFFLQGVKQYLPHYRTYYMPWACGACKLAMHVKAIEYNKTHGLQATFDGANFESAPYFPDQTRGYIEIIKKLYEKHDMIYDTPAFKVPKTDVVTEEYGMTTTHDTKKQHVIYRAQHTCVLGLMVHVHSRLYYRPFRGKDRMEKLTTEFLSNVLEDCSLLKGNGIK